MGTKDQKFVVSELPPWYSQSTYKNAFFCKNTHRLYEDVATLMVRKRDALSDRERKYNPNTTNKLIRDMVIRDAGSLSQSPTHSLLLVLMDLADISSGNEMESLAGLDKAGLKHVLLAYSNYTIFYVPTEGLRGVKKRDKRVIPVVTQYYEKHNFAYQDNSRSMIGTYIVQIPTHGKNGQEKSYFMQEVIHIPGSESLEMLKRITGQRFEFWDIALEVPTHPAALTPSFRKIHPSQLLRVKDTLPSAQSGGVSQEVPSEEKLQPMCCLSNGEDAAADCFTETQISCSLKQFHYEKRSNRVVYLRTSGSRCERRRLHLLPVVALRGGQADRGELYISTTVKFLRAIKQSCVRGTGEAVSYWDETLRDLTRETFVTGPDVYRDILGPALAAFSRRVNPNSWYHRVPRHVESAIRDPIMLEVVTLAITLMENAIPNAFPVAELLYCPIEKVRDYLTFWNAYAGNGKVRATVTKARIGMIKRQIREDWVVLSSMASEYLRACSSTEANIQTKKALRELFVNSNITEIGKIQRLWRTLFNCDMVRKSKDRNLAGMCANAKVLFLKLRTYHNRLMKELKLGDSKRSRKYQQGHSDAVKELCNLGDLRDVKLTEQHIQRRMAGVSGKSIDTRLCSIVTPESVPIHTWLKNMSTLLLCEPWLNDDSLRREAVCSVLGLDESLLDKRHSSTLHEWVLYNRSVVEILEQKNLEDRLSKALVDCLHAITRKGFKTKTASFQSTLQSKQAEQKEDIGTCRSRSFGKASECAWLLEAEEAINSEEETDYEAGEEELIRGEDLQDTLDYDETESLDDYDYDDKFIDDRVIEPQYSLSEDDNDETFSVPNGNVTCKKAKRKTRSGGRNHAFRRVLAHSSSDEEDDDDDSESLSAADEDKARIWQYKRRLESEDDDYTMDHMTKQDRWTEESSKRGKDGRCLGTTRLTKELPAKERGWCATEKCGLSETEKKCGLSVTTDKPDENNPSPSGCSHSTEEDYEGEGSYGTDIRPAALRSPQKMESKPQKKKTRRETSIKHQGHTEKLDRGRFLCWDSRDPGKSASSRGYGHSNYPAAKRVVVDAAASSASGSCNKSDLESDFNALAREPDRKHTGTKRDHSDPEYVVYM